MNPLTAFVGNATEDTILHVRAQPHDDAVSVADRKVECLGGRGVVPALVAAALGMDAGLCTVVGADHRSQVACFLEAHGVDHTLVKWDAEHDGITEYVAFVDPREGTTLAAAKAAELDWRCTSTQAAGIRAASMVYLSTNPARFNHGLLNVISRDDHRLIHSLGVHFEDAPGYIQEMLEKAWVIIGNRDEVERVERATGAGVAELVRRFALHGAVVTSGARQVVAHWAGEPDPVTYVPQRVSGPTVPIGAGDSFAAGLLFALSRGRPLYEALDLAGRCGRLAAESDVSYPDLSRISALLQE